MTLPLSTIIQPGGTGAGSGPGGTDPVVNPTSSTTDPNYVTFRKASYTPDAHGGPSPAYPGSVTMLATVAITGTPAPLPEHAYAEPRPLSRMIFKVTTTQDPSTYLAAPLASLDLIDWGGRTLSIIGTSFYQGGAYETLADLIA